MKQKNKKHIFVIMNSETLPYEETNKKKSAAITTLIVGILLFICFILPIATVYDPPIDDSEYVIGGGIDFGNFTEGSSTINNFSDPSENAGDGSKASSSSDKPSDEGEETIGGNDDSQVEVPDNKKDKVKNPKEIKKDTKTDNKDSKDTKGGSNDGKNTKGTGNKGRPDSKVLDPNGLYAFGDGNQGLMGRIPLSLPQPKYNVEAETKITFELEILPNGTVKRAKALTLSSNIDLKNAAETALKKWKFNEIDSDKTQKTKVTITFKLK